MFSRFLAVLVACVLVVTRAMPIVDLSPDNFDEMTQGEMPMLIKFYAPWCGHCQTLAPVLEEVAMMLDGHAMVGKVNCDMYGDAICRHPDFAVRGYPTLKLMKDGMMYDFAGPRTKESLEMFVKNGFMNQAGKLAPRLKPEEAPMAESMMNMGTATGIANNKLFDR